jgi:hypothetical protein
MYVGELGFDLASRRYDAPSRCRASSVRSSSRSSSAARATSDGSEDGLTLGVTVTSISATAPGAIWLLSKLALQGQIAGDQGRDDSSLGLQCLDEVAELLELGEQLVAPRPCRQLASNGFQRHFALEKCSQPLDGRVLDDRQPDPPVFKAEGSIERPRPMLRQAKSRSRPGSTRQRFRLDAAPDPQA